MKIININIEFTWKWTDFSVGLGYVKEYGFGIQVGFLTIWFYRG